MTISSQVRVDAVSGDYVARAAAHGSKAAAATRILGLVGAARVVCFLAIVLDVAAIIAGRGPTAFAWLLLLCILAMFVGLVVWHRRARDLERTYDALRRSCLTGIDRIHRRWDALPAARPITFPADHAFAGDLHLIGRHSLTKLLPAMSPAAMIVTSEWLLADDPPSVEALLSRQRAVRSLVELDDWRERLSMYAGRLNGTPESMEAFFRWAESEVWLRPRAWLRVVVYALTATTVPLLLASVAHLISPVFGLVFIVANLVITGFSRRKLTSTLVAASSSGARLRGYGTLFQHARAGLGDEPALRDLGERIGGEASGGAFTRLDQLAACGEVRLSAMGHFVLQSLVLWDFHVVDALERWQCRHGQSVRHWVRALGQVEALSAFATLAHENPSWTFPSFHSDAAGTLEASAMAHPLLAADVRVGNDVAIGPRGTILLVTGSNMAGKTTLLRAVALNVVLAQAGAPVCADALAQSRFRLRTSMHASDSLEEGLSLFMAELVRLKGIVDAARVASESALLYLADEILRGTNAADRHSAIITVLETLVGAGAVGVVATHDADLARAPTLERQIRTVNLIEQFRYTESGGQTMWFDYRLRPGVATTRNAIKLLEMVGLGASR